MAVDNAHVADEVPYDLIPFPSTSSQQAPLSAEMSSDEIIETIDEALLDPIPLSPQPGYDQVLWWGLLLPLSMAWRYELWKKLADLEHEDIFMGTEVGREFKEYGITSDNIRIVSFRRVGHQASNLMIALASLSRGKFRCCYRTTKRVEQVIRLISEKLELSEHPTWYMSREAPGTDRSRFATGTQKISLEEFTKWVERLYL